MTRDEIFENRREVAKKLLSSLREYGSLGKANTFSSRPYCDGEKKYRFSMANYLRLAAMNSHYGDLHDPRWYTMEDISRNGWELKEYARPEPLEVWQASPDGGKTCELVDFYHASDIPELEPLPDKEATLKECLTELQAKNVLGVSDKVSLLDGLQSVQEYARSHGANELASVMASQIWLTESGVRANYNVQRNLYSEELLTAAENHPDILFTAAHQAQEALNKLEHEQKKELASTKEEAFSGLELCYYWCETDMKDTKGETYPEDTILTGKAAYEFLVQYNAMDKRSFNEKFAENRGYHKSGIEFRYKDYDHGEMRIDLGDLELGSRTSVTDALIYRLDMYRQNLLKDPALAKRHWTENQQEGKKEGTFEEFLDRVRKESADFRSRMEEFRQEENSYLASHPELEAINHERANTFLYTVKAEDIDRLPYGIVMDKVSDSVPEGHLLKELNFAVRDYIATYPANPIPYQNLKERSAQANFTTEKVVTFSSGWHPSDIAHRLERDHLPPVWVAVPPKEQELFHQLGDFHLNITHSAPCGINGHERSLDYRGYSALRTLNEELGSEDREARTAVEQRFSLRGEQMKISLSYKEEPLFHASYESGKQELLALINEQNGILPDDLRESVATISKYLLYDSRPTEILQRVHPIWENFPTMEESRENYIKDCKADLDIKDTYRAANYYSIVTLLNPEVNSAEDFSKCMVEEMVKDGITPGRMNKIIEQSRVHVELKEKIKQIVQSPETRSAIRKAKTQMNEQAETTEITDAR